MLHEFVTANRAEILARCRARTESGPAPRPTDAEFEHGLPRFLDQVTATLREPEVAPHPSIGESAAKHGHELLNRGFTIGQVVHDYGGVCQAITELAVERSKPISAAEFQSFNLCLDDAIAGAVTEYGRLRASEGTEHLGSLTHELRNLLASAVLAFEALKSGRIGIGGSTGAVLSRSLSGIRKLIERELVGVRLAAHIPALETVVVRELAEEVEVEAKLEADSRGLQFSMQSAAADAMIRANRPVLAAVLANLLQNAFKFTKPGGHIFLRVHATADRVVFEVEDQCGGLPPGKAEELFGSFEQRGADRSGLGLGLGICDRGVRLHNGKIHVRDRPGIGCAFTVDLPRHLAGSVEV